MITEQYVTFETAKLLKQAGFDLPCTSQYTENGFGWDDLRKVNYNEYGALLSRPTQAIAARWLREVHRIVVDATFIPPSTYGDAWRYFIGEMDDMVWNGDYVPSDEFYETYEKALEAGLQEAIKMIKSKDYEEDNVQ